MRSIKEIKHKIKINKVGILTSGGDAPGMNAAIRAAVLAGKHYNVEVAGIYNGYTGLLEDHLEILNQEKVNDIVYRGGTILYSDRCLEFRQKEGRKRAYKTIEKHGLDGLIVIGGNGTFTGALKLWQEFGVPIIGIPGTIDNDLFGTDITIGFDTAANTAMQAIDRIRDTAYSHQRIFIVEVMGRNTGYIAMDVGLACGADAIILPESPLKIAELASKIKLKKKQGNKSFLIVSAEGNEKGRSQKMALALEEKYNLSSHVCILGHIQRGGNPSCRDRKVASILGGMALRDLKEGFTNIMVGVRGWSPQRTPLYESIYEHKEMHRDLFLLTQVLSPSS